MNYRRNEDMLCDVGNGKPKYNSVIEVSFVEGTYSGSTFTAGTAVEPVTLAEAKIECDVTYSDQDNKITALITQCRKALENYLGISMVVKQVTAILNNGTGNIELPYGPVIAFTSATDIDGTALTDYQLRGTAFKYVESPINNYTTYQYIAGYTTVPADLKKALLLEIAWRFENPGYKDVKPGLSEAAKTYASSYSRKTWIA